jgi:hypothetical protein
MANDYQQHEQVQQDEGINNLNLCNIIYMICINNVFSDLLLSYDTCDGSEKELWMM